VQTVGKGRQSILSGMIDKSTAQISQWINASKDSKTGVPRVLARKTAREIEQKLGLTEGWMDQPVREDETLDLPDQVVADVLQFPESIEHGARPLILRLAEMMKPLDEADREQAGVLLRRVAMQPERAGEWADKVSRLLGDIPQASAGNAAAG